MPFLPAKLVALHWTAHLELISRVGIFCLAIGLSYALAAGRRGSAGGLLRHAFPEGWRTRSARLDVLFFVLEKVTSTLALLGDFLLRLAIAGAVAGFLDAAAPLASRAPFGPVAAVGAAAALFAVNDLCTFLSHYAEHKIPALWEIHKVHHSATFLSPLTNSRRHILQDKIDDLVKTLLGGVAYGVIIHFFRVSALELVPLWFAAHLLVSIATLNVLHHSHLQVNFGWLNRIFVSPHMHQLHHSARPEDWDCNFGAMLSVWDVLFGTYREPVRGEPIVYGIGRGEEVDKRYTTIWGLYGRPVIDMCARLAPARREPAAQPSHAGPPTRSRPRPDDREDRSAAAPF